MQLTFFTRKTQPPPYDFNDGQDRSELWNEDIPRHWKPKQKVAVKEPSPFTFPSAEAVLARVIYSVLLTITIAVMVNWFGMQMESDASNRLKSAIETQKSRNRDLAEEMQRTNERMLRLIAESQEQEIKLALLMEQRRGKK